MRQYQLVLQFPGRSGADYDTMVALEASLSAALGEGAEVDGHDVGTDAMNLFILADDPHATFELAKPLLERHEQLEWALAAFRQVDADHYTVIWPQGWRKEFRIG